jgi:hypothetical protein
MMPHGVLAQNELRRHLTPAQAPGQQTKDLHLSASQLSWPPLRLAPSLGEGSRSIRAQLVHERRKRIRVTVVSGSSASGNMHNYKCAANLVAEVSRLSHDPGTICRRALPVDNQTRASKKLPTW